MEQVTAETNEPVSRIQWENETLLWIIDAQFSINLLIDNTDNEDIKTLLSFSLQKNIDRKGVKKLKQGFLDRQQFGKRIVLWEIKKS